MISKREARTSYLQGVRTAMAEQMRITEDELQRLPGVDAALSDKLIASVRKRHDRMLQKLDNQIALEVRSPA